MKRPSPALLAEWRAKLAASGFDDHENAAGRLRVVGPQRGVDPVTLMEGNGHHLRAAEYFDALSAAMADRRFVVDWSPRQRRVIELHVEGKSFREIRRATGCSHGWDTKTVRAFRRKAGIRV